MGATGNSESGSIDERDKKLESVHAALQTHDAALWEQHKQAAIERRVRGATKNICKGKKRTGKKRGGQPGHKGHRRQLIAAEEVDEIIDHFASHCEVCRQALPKTEQQRLYRHQVVELDARGGAAVTEHRCHAVTYVCGVVTRGPMRETESHRR